MMATAHQSSYLPWLGLFHKIAVSDVFISLNNVQYQPEDWNNRNFIKTQSGSLLLSVPIIRKGYLHKTINDMEIANEEPWARKHWTSIQLAYSKAPYFKRYSEFFIDIYSRRWTYLAELNETVLKGLLAMLNITTPIQSAQQLKLSGNKSELILDICRQSGADEYFFGKLGQDYADNDLFFRNKIKIHFQDYIHPRYPQLHGEFVSHMSIIDLLFNCGDESKDILLSNNLNKKDFLST